MIEPSGTATGWTAIGPMLVCLAVVLTVAVTARVGWTGYGWWTTPAGAPLPFPDEQDYWTGAVGLADGEGLIDVDGRRATRMPLYPALLSLFVHLPANVWWARLAQSVLGALAAPLIAALAWRLTGRRTAWVAGLLVAVDPFCVYFSQLLLSETLFTTGLAAFWVVSWPLAMPDGRRRSWRWPLAGLIFLALVYLRPSAIGLLPVWAVFLAISSRRQGGNFAGVNLIVVMLIAGMVPWAWRNHRLLGQPVLLTTRSGISLYDGQGPHADGSSDLASTRAMEADRLGECEWNQWFRDQAFEAMRDDPRRVVRLAWTKLVRTWDPFPHAAEAQSSFVQAVSSIWSLAVYALLLPGVWHLRRRLGGLLLLLLPAVYFSLVHMIYVGSIRYRLPVMPLIEIISAVGVCWLLGLIHPTWRPAVPKPPPLPTDYAPPTWLERQVMSARLGRLPVSIWRRRLAAAALIVLAMGYYAYRFATSDERIRQMAVGFLARLTGGEVRISLAKFDLFTGITLRDVKIATPTDVRIDPTAKTFDDRLAFAALSLQLRYEPTSLLIGKLKVTEILATEPTVKLVKNADYHPTRPYNWQALLPPRPKKPLRGRSHLPLIRMRNAHVHISEILKGKRHAEPSIDISALALPDQRDMDMYTLAWRKSGKQPERGKLFYTLQDGAYTGELPAVPMTTVRAALPERYTEWLATLEIGGQIKPNHIRYDPKKGRQATIRLDGVRFSVPMGTQERPATQAARRFLRLSDVTGQIILTPNESRAKVEGKLNNAPCKLEATVKHYAGPLEEAGFDVHLVTTNIRLPDPNDPVGARFIRQVRSIRNFFKDFSPSGLVDADFSLRKAAGSKDHGVILRGSLTAKGCSASYRMFPYRLANVTGRVRFTDQGVYLDDLAGDHGSGFVVVNGHLDKSTWYTGLRLSVTGDAVPLDPVLYRAVPERFRNIWRKFEPVGLANINVRLDREPGSSETGTGKWSTRIEAELIDNYARFVGFPYRLRHMGGTLTIDNNRIRLTNLAGTHGSASVSLSGEAGYGKDDKRELELRLEADRLLLDEDLAGALPDDSRKTFDQIRPTGQADLLGRVFMEQGGDIAYTIAAHPRNAEILYDSLPVPIDRINGTVVFTPRKVDVPAISGRRGHTEVAISGSIDRRPSDTLTDLSVSCDRLQLDKPLYEALTDDLKKTWDKLSPTGEIRLRTRVRKSGSGPTLVSTHDTTIEALGNTIKFTSLPLPLGDVRGGVHITDELVEIHGMTGRHGPGRIRLDGTIPLIGKERAGKLQLNVKGMPFSDTLRDAMPKRIRETLTGIKPTGTFDLDLDELTCRMAPDRPTKWEFGGRITLHDASLDIGFQATQLDGSLVGKGTAGGDGAGLAVNANLEVDRMAIDGRVLTDVTGRMSRPTGSDVLFLDDVIAGIYGGRASGVGRVNFGPKETRYALHLIVREMALGPFLNSTRPKDTPPTKAKGSVDARLYLGGVSGKTASRQGTGEVHVRHAQMYKLPFVLAMLGTINFTIPDDNAFHDAQARFHLAGNQLVFETVELQGKSLSMLGAGSMNTETEDLDLTFITGSPHPLPRLPILLELARSVSRELMEIEITGPLSEPSMKGRPLRSLRSTLKAIFAPDKRPARAR